MGRSGLVGIETGHLREPGRPGHVVLAQADSAPYGSLRSRPLPRAERYALGKDLRHQVPRSALADWQPAADRRSVVDQIREAHEGRLERLVPVRIGRMAASPYGFLRGTAGLMAADLATLPATGITPVICGDSHIGNVGLYGSPSRELVLDLNDFDEAHPGPWEWDLRRLVASTWVAGRQAGLTEDSCARAVRAAVRGYREHLHELSEQPLLERSWTSFGVDRLASATKDPGLRHEVERAAKRARHRTSDRALPRFTEVVAQEAPDDTPGGAVFTRRIVVEPPLITRPEPDDAPLLAEALDNYLSTLAPHWGRLLGGYTLVDIAHKVVGVGSVGLRAYVALLEGSDSNDVVFLQLKQARRSVVAPFVHGDNAWHKHQGQRVVEYEQALQTTSDPLLGWTTVGERQYYVRQFRNMKGSVVLDGIGANALRDYAGVCAQLLAKGHARTSGASMIAGYLGSSDKADDALATFARRYADQTEADHAELVKAVQRGLLPAERGV
ncbi:Uncharacterized conserved protein, DUF2252 family [Quadrisphaera granulorum]|uniref:Uncharacterized protein (DUF2252 family) n=1 Tax=Quadrisphaera granulorum TaxID=317664 RepID=A0A316AFH9_9ACTN|nr:uncharacterized protein (DUF2252 family) [Quadrisphaera granulorum]SZE94966.1 Uncharacterized conserved protein, DUF2252 family [Quadrisphaera granulorum]